MRNPLQGRAAVIALGLVALVLAASRLSPVAAAPPVRLFHAIRPWTIGGEGGWDCLLADAEGRRLYVSHGTRVEVLDLDHGDSIGVIAPTPGAHAIAVASELGRGFVSCGRDSSVLIFDLRDLHTVERVALPARNPDLILYEPLSKRVLAFNGGSANATVLDGATGAIVGSVDLGGTPEFAVADGKGRVFVNIEDKSEVLELDPRELRVVRRWSIAPGEGPSGLAMDRAHRRLFSVCGNQKMVVSDADSGKVIATLPIGDRVDGVAFDPKRGLAISSNGEGTITVVREASPQEFVVAETDTTQRGARTIALDERTGALYLATADFGPAPAPTPDRPRPRPAVVPGTFRVLVLRP
jgi:DNA-binding beta-propeller fold protein YncE